MNGRSLLISCFFVLLTAISVGTYAFDVEEMKLTLGEHQLSIPKSNIIDPNVPFWLRLIPGLAPSTGEILLLIDAEDIANQVEGYQAYDGELKNNIHLRISVLDVNALNQILDPQMHVYSDAWYGRGLLEGRTIELHEKSRFYKLYRGDDTFWTAVKISPDASQPIPDDPFAFWVASCHKGEAPLTKSGFITSCLTKMVYDNLLLDFSLNGINLGVVDGVKTMLSRQLLLWKNQK